MHAMDNDKKTPLRRPRLVSVTSATEETFWVTTPRGKASILVIPRYLGATAREILFKHAGVKLEKDKLVRLTNPETNETLQYSPIMQASSFVRLAPTE